MSQTHPTGHAGVSRRHFLATGQAALAAGAALAAARAAGGIDLAPPDKQPPHLPMPKPMDKKVGFAIVGLGELALGQILPAFKNSQHCRPVALVSGHPDKAKAVAPFYGVDPGSIYNYDNFDKIADNSEINVVYVVLPNSMHAEYTVRALKAGKHVLCEKPMATSVSECEQMIAAARAADRKLMIAYRLRYEPFNQTIIEISRKQEYGPIRSIEASNMQDVQAPNIRLSKKLGGGPLGDVGIYCINAFRYITGEEPFEVSGIAHQPSEDPRFAEVPATVNFLLKFPSGVIAHGGCGFNSATSRNYRVFAKDAWYGLDPAFDYTGLRMKVGTQKGVEEIKLPQVDQFAAEMDHLAECIANNKPVRTPGEEGLADMKVIAKIEESIAKGAAVKV